MSCVCVCARVCVFGTTFLKVYTFRFTSAAMAMNFLHACCHLALVLLLLNLASTSAQKVTTLSDSNTKNKQRTEGRAGKETRRAEGSGS